VAKQRIGIFGGSGLVGELLLTHLAKYDYAITAFTRTANKPRLPSVTWQSLPCQPSEQEVIPLWICAAPIWVLMTYFPMLEAYGAKRIVCLSSTSVFTKAHSANHKEQEVADLLANAETQLQVWSANHHVEWIILRPTLIYGYGRDKNIAEIARFIKRFGFFPLFGKAQGLRQPIHANDVAKACVIALDASHISNQCYHLPGGESLSYADMVTRIFAAMDQPVRTFSVPLIAFKWATRVLRLIPRYKDWSSTMAERMNTHQVFDHVPLKQDLAFTPGDFILHEEDISV
jgi:nucleoside-diphosphate-sugar epimerase